MDQKKVEELLRESLEDRRMSRNERGALRDLMDRFIENRHERDWLRSRVFAIAQESLIGPDARDTVEWLESVAGLLVQAERGETSTETQEPDEALFSPGKSCRARIQEAIRTAKKSVDICVFTVTDDRISDSILEAFRRHKGVRIISDNAKADDLGNDVRRLSSQGVPVVFDSTPHHMHHKFAVFDQRSVITGSYNWTRSAADDNHENLVVLSDVGVVAAFQTEFNRLWRRFGGL